MFLVEIKADKVVDTLPKDRELCLQDTANMPRNFVL